MNSLIERFTGLRHLTDQMIAADMLISAKSGVINYAVAIIETATPEIKAILAKQLEEAINTQEQISLYMVGMGFYHPYNVNEQVELDRQNIATALSIPS
jgi:similar to spore coat protein